MYAISGPSGEAVVVVVTSKLRLNSAWSTNRYCWAMVGWSGTSACVIYVSLFKMPGHLAIHAFLRKITRLKPPPKQEGGWSKWKDVCFSGYHSIGFESEIFPLSQQVVDRDGFQKHIVSFLYCIKTSKFSRHFFDGPLTWMAGMLKYRQLGIVSCSCLIFLQAYRNLEGHFPTWITLRKVVFTSQCFNNWR